MVTLFAPCGAFAGVVQVLMWALLRQAVRRDGSVLKGALNAPGDAQDGDGSSVVVQPNAPAGAQGVDDFSTLIDGLSVTHKVRVVTLDGAPWFVAADVRRVLGVSQSGDNFANLHADEKRVAPKHLLTGKGMAQALLLSETGLYKFIMRSDKPVARPFQDWVTREVLPAIRKTGEFKLAPGEAIPLPASFTDALRQHAATLIKLAEEQEVHAKTKAEAEAAQAAKAQAQAEVSRLEPMVAACA